MFSNTESFCINHAYARKMLVPCLLVVYFFLSLWLLASAVGSSRYLSDFMRPTIVKQRVLVETVVQAVAFVTPDNLRASLTQQLIEFRDSAVAKRILRIKSQPYDDNVKMFFLSDVNIFYFGVKAFVMYLTELLFLYMLYSLTLLVFPDSRTCALLSPLLAILVISSAATRYAYSYDFAELFFSCAFLHALFRQRFLLYLVLVALGTLCKETTIFGIFFFAIWFFTRLPQRQYLLLLGLQISIYAIIRASVIMIYGSVNMDYLKPERLAGNIMGLELGSYYTALSMLGTILLLSYGWKEKPLFLRYALLMFLPNLVAYILTCNSGEYRDFYWSMPPMWLLATHTMVQLTNIDNAEIWRKS